MSGNEKDPVTRALRFHTRRQGMRITFEDGDGKIFDRQEFAYRTSREVLDEYRLKSRGVDFESQWLHEHVMTHRVRIWKVGSGKLVANYTLAHFLEEIEYSMTEEEISSLNRFQLAALVNAWRKKSGLPLFKKRWALQWEEPRLRKQIESRMTSSDEYYYVDGYQILTVPALFISRNHECTMPTYDDICSMIGYPKGAEDRTGKEGKK